MAAITYRGITVFAFPATISSPVVSLRKWPVDNVIFEPNHAENPTESQCSAVSMPDFEAFSIAEAAGTQVTSQRLAHPPNETPSASHPPRRTSAQHASSSLAPRQPYSLVDSPPVVEISKSSFARKAKAFHDGKIREIAANPQEYSPRVCAKAERTAEVAEQYGTTTYDSEDARYFSYQLGKRSAGLLRMEGGFDMHAVFEGEQWREKFPGRERITSTVDLRITHPGGHPKCPTCGHSNCSTWPG